MATEDDLLKALQSIDKTLKSASALSANGRTFAGKLQQSQRDRADKEARRAFKAVAVGAKETNDALLGLNKSLVTLTKEVDDTGSAFGALNVQLGRFMSSLQPVEAPEPVHTPIAAQEKLLRLLTENHRQVVATLRHGTDAVVKGLSVLGQSPTSPAPISAFNAQVAALAAGMSTLQQRGLQPLGQALTSVRVPFNLTVTRMVQRFGLVGSAATGLETMFSNLFEVAKRVTVDFLALSRTGLGSVSNLTDLYVSAAKAGMSLKEYTELLRENASAAARAGSLDEFDRLVSAADKQLAVLGVFGAEARGLQASLAQSGTLLGVRQDALAQSIAQQVRLFDELHRSTNMTAEEFAKLVSSVAGNEQVQRELVGLAPRERAARQAQLQQLAATGYRLGLTAEASQKLAEALIEQRKASVKDRIEQGGVLRQLGAFLGQGALGERAAQLNLKGRRRTTAEDDELRQLLGQLDRASQGLYEVGSLGAQNVLDQFEELLGKGGLGRVMGVNRTAELAQDSGAVANRDFGRHVGEFGQWVGRLTAWARGLQESLLGPLSAAVGGALLVAFRGPIAKVLASTVGRLGGGATTAVAGGAAAAAAKGGGALAALTGPLRSFTGLVTGVGASLKAYVQGLGTTFTTMRTYIGPGYLGNLMGAGATIAKVSSGIMAGLSAFTRAFAPAAALIDGVIEAVTGEVAAALNPSGGFFERVGGVITAALSALPNFIISALELVLGKELTGGLQRGFDMFVTLANAAVRAGLSQLTGTLSTTLKYILPKDSGLVKLLDGWSSKLLDSTDENFRTFDRLWSDSSATLRSIAKDAEAAGTQAVKSTDAAAKRVAAAQQRFNNVQLTEALTANGLLQDARTLLAQPQVQSPTAVRTAPVNTPAEAANAVAAPSSTVAVPTTDTTELAELLRSILQVLRQNLETQQRQAASAEALLRARPPAAFTSSELIADKLLKRTS